MIQTTRHIELLDCTLRDGSYAVDYQFTAQDTALFCAGLEQAGFKQIEIGHGLGLNASRAGHGQAAATDEEYLKSAASTLSRARFGMFCIPGIARLEDLDMLVNYGASFVRIGTNISDVESAAPFIERAKQLGLWVSANLMKSYAVPIQTFACKARMVDSYGADVISVVDSAGGMLPDEVREYVTCLCGETGRLVGLHSHNNLQLAIANAIEAFRAGATVIDCTLQGIGRDAGNAQTEILAMVTEKLGYDTGVSSMKVLDLGERLIRPVIQRRPGVDAMSVASGIALFHSSFMATVLRAADRYGVDARELMLRIGDVEKITVTDELADSIARQLKETADPERRVIGVPDVHLWVRDAGEATGTLEETAKRVAKEMLSLAKKTGKRSVMTISQTLDRSHAKTRFPFIRCNEWCVIGNAEVASADDALIVASTCDGQVDVIMIDADFAPEHRGDVRATVSRSRLLVYDESKALVGGVVAHVARLFADLMAVRVLVVGVTRIGWEVAMGLARHGANVAVADPGGSDLAPVAEAINRVRSESGVPLRYVQLEPALLAATNLLIGAAPFAAAVGRDIVKSTSSTCVCLDVGIGSFTTDAVAWMTEVGRTLYRVDMRAGLSGEVVTVLETDEVVRDVIGKSVIAGVEVVAGGIIGRRGAVVVDSNADPNEVLGVADGKGGLLRGEEEKQYLAAKQSVGEALLKRRLFSNR